MIVLFSGVKGDVIIYENDNNEWIWLYPLNDNIVLLLSIIIQFNYNHFNNNYNKLNNIIYW